VQKFAPNLADLAKPLRELVKKDTEFVWDKKVLGQCLNQVKQVLTQAQVLRPPKEDRTPVRRLYECFWGVLDTR